MPTLLEALARRDTGALHALLAEDVRFRSPAADYAGRSDVVHLLATIGGVVSDVRTTRTLVDGRSTTTFLTAAVGEHALQGVLDEQCDEAGRVTDAMLLLRPYPALRAAMGAMQARLAGDPLPSVRGGAARGNVS
jgi:hypothetical protein